jgi:hypothetical protein
MVMRGANYVELRVAERAHKVQQARRSGSQAEIRCPGLRTVRMADAEQIDGVNIPLLGKEIEVVPPTEAVSQQAVDEDQRWKGLRGWIGSGQVEIAHAVRSAGKPQLPFLQKTAALKLWQVDLLPDA